jgi:hypothetical protein
MVTVSDYGAETPINALEQLKSQHDEAVDQGSETRFSVNPKHRFERAASGSWTPNGTATARK